jgi:ribonuclease P protein component
VTNKPINIEKVFNKLKKENEFELVYNKGSAIISGDKKIKANYFLKSDTENKNIKIGLSISSNKGNSVWRNKIKRLIREAIRLNRETLLSTLEQKNANLFIIFSPHSINQTNNKKIFLKDIKASVLDIITRLKNKLVPAN